jgi:hypothetical protein
MDYSFLPSYHIKNIRHLKEIKLEIEYNNLMQTIKTYYKENNIGNFQKNNYKIYK